MQSGDFDDVCNNRDKWGRGGLDQTGRATVHFVVGVGTCGMLAVVLRIDHHAGAMYVGEEFEQLRLLLWNRQTFEITEEEALNLYESNRQWVDVAAMSNAERAFFDTIVIRFGRGVFLG